jgi:hexosaminidase
MIFPRMMALSEVLWSPKEKRDWKDFERRLPSVLERLDKKKVNYSKAYYDLQATLEPAPNNNGLQWKLESKNKSSIIKYQNILPAGKQNTYSKPIPVTQNSILNAWSETGTAKSVVITQSVKFNKATGKKIIIINEPSKNYPGDGAFTLVNGVQNDKGLSKGNEFLGFLAKDCEGTIDFGKTVKVRKIRIHSLNQNGSWIYPPKYIEVSSPSITGKRILRVDKPLVEKDGNILYEIDFGAATEMTMLNFKIANFGIIPSGNPGAGTAAWLFVDEIEAE